MGKRLFYLGVPWDGLAWEDLALQLSFSPCYFFAIEVDGVQIATPCFKDDSYLSVSLVQSLLFDTP
jgi:hypothetical protein